VQPRRARRLRQDEVIVEATGHPGAGIRHALACCRHKRHIVMVNVEADALAGPVVDRQVLGALAGADHAKPRRAGPVDDLGDERRLVAIGSR
jgi:hypothetical protein